MHILTLANITQNQTLTQNYDECDKTKLKQNILFTIKYKNKIYAHFNKAIIKT